VAAFSLTGADELIFNPAQPNLDEVDKLAEVVL
jgi:hypothetical protein